MMGVCWMFGLWWGSASGPSLPLALTPGPSPAQRERGDVSIAWNGFGWCLGALVLGWRGGCLPYPALLSAPVTLTLTLSRRAGEGGL